MAIVKVEVPNGKLCNGCQFNERGTVWCSLFGKFLKENDNYTDKYKCDDCPKK